MDIRKLVEEGCTEEIEQQLIDLDSEFRFKCRKCGKCCKHQNTILFNTRDILKIACKLQIRQRQDPLRFETEFAPVYVKLLPGIVRSD